MTKQSTSDKQKIKRLKYLANQRDIEILKLLGIERVGRYGTQQSCPIHGGDNPAAFSYNTNKHIWSCFSQNCHKELGNDIIGLIRGVRECGFDEAITWLEETLDFDNSKVVESLDEKIETEIAESINRRKTNEVISEERLQGLVKDYSILSDRNFKKETLEFFEGGVSKKGPMIHHRFMIPIRNVNSEIVGFTGRSIYPKCDKCQMYHKEGCPPKKYIHLYSKWYNYPKAFNKNIELYGLNEAKESIFKTNTAIIVEGPFDKWRLWEYGIHNVVATFGVNLSTEQCIALTKAGCLNLIILYDPDSAGIKATKKVYDKSKDLFNTYIPILPSGIDPGEINQDDCNEFIKPIIEKAISAY